MGVEDYKLFSDFKVKKEKTIHLWHQFIPQTTKKRVKSIYSTTQRIPFFIF